MEEKHREVLRANRIEIVRDLDVDNATSFLYSKSILSENDRDEIKAIETLQSKSEKLLDILPRRGPEAFGFFLEFLDKNQRSLGDLLKSYKGSTGTKEPVDNAPLHNLDDEKSPKETDEELRHENSQNTCGNTSSSCTQEDGKWSKWRLPKPNEEVNPKSHENDKDDKEKKPDYFSSHKDVITMEDVYSMTHSPRGEAFIINNKNFLRESGMQEYPRNGTDVDRDALYELFTKLGFNTIAYDDQTTKQIKELFRRYASRDHSKHDCIICAVLTYGEEGLFYGTDGTIPIKELTSVFRGRLPGKPKLFFFQACQETVDKAKDEIDGPRNNKITLPCEADFMYGYSTVPGYYSWRNSIKGSWFVQAIDSVFRKYSKSMDLLRMMTRVIWEVEKQMSNINVPHLDNKIPIPSNITQLRKQVYFFPENVFDDQP